MFKSNIVVSKEQILPDKAAQYEELMLKNKALSGVLLGVYEVSNMSTEILALFACMNNNDEIMPGLQASLSYCGLLGSTSMAVSPAYGNFPMSVITPEGRKALKETIMWAETYNIHLTQLDRELLFNYGNRKVKSKYCDIIQAIRQQYISTNSYQPSRYYMYNDSLIGYFFEEIYELSEICGRLFSTIETDYDPLKPFSIILSETINDVKSSTNNRTRNLVDNSTYSGADNVLNDEILQSTYGFTQGTPRNTGKEVGKRNTTSSSTDNVQRTGTDKYVINHDDTHTRNYTRSGNIGNANYSKLIEEERKKIKFEFRKYIIESIVDILCDGTWCD